MKTRLQTSLGQQLVLTPQLRQAIHLLQLSGVELEAELATAVESNPLLDWEETPPLTTEQPSPSEEARDSTDGSGSRDDDDAPHWEHEPESWSPRSGGGGGEDDDGDASERVVEPETLVDHLQWQLHLSHLSPRDLRIGVALIDAIDEDGYL